MPLLFLRKMPGQPQEDSKVKKKRLESEKNKSSPIEFVNRSEIFHFYFELIHQSVTFLS